MTTERIVKNLNRGLHSVFEQEDSVYLIGEDILDPYGGAFKVSKGLSTKYPDRVISTPLSELSIIGLGNGLALTGQKPIVEIMFGDFVALGFDQILNFSSKSVSMFGQKLELNFVIRCPVGGHRGYGPTHSQSLQKFFIGIPNLSLYELTPFHDNSRVFSTLVNLGNPCIYFENKILYTHPFYSNGSIDDLHSFEFLGDGQNFARVFPNECDRPDVTIIALGGMVPQCLTAMKNLFIDNEIETQCLVPLKIYPLDLEPIAKHLESSDHIFIVEECTAGGTWGSETAQQVYDRMWGKIENKIGLIHSKDSIIPNAKHLEREVLVTEEDIQQAVQEVGGV